MCDRRVVPARNLSRAANFGGAIKKVNLHSEAKMTPLPANNVVLISGSDFKSVQIALNYRIGVNGVSIPDDVATEGSSLRSPKRNDDHVKVVLASEFPINFSSEGRIGAKVEIGVEINRNGVALSPDMSHGLGIKPICVEPDLVIIELIGLLRI